MRYHSLSIDKALDELKTSKELGLTTKEAQKRQYEYGFNLLESKKGESIFSRFISQFKDFMIVVLIIAAIISFFVSLIEGKADFVDPLIIFTIIIVNAVLGVVQETKAERSLEALKKMAAPSAMVIRDGNQATIPAKDLVPGDIILLETGYYVPADARLITAINLKVDESSLTGESHPVEKNADVTLKEATMLGDRKNMVSSSGIITYGRGLAVVTHRAGNIRKALWA